MGQGQPFQYNGIATSLRSSQRQMGGDILRQAQDERVGARYCRVPVLLAMTDGAWPLNSAECFYQAG